MTATQDRNDSTPFRKQGKILDQSEYNQIADLVPDAVESAIAVLRKSGFEKTADLIEAQPIDG